MNARPQISLARLVSVVALVGSVYGIGTSIYSSIQKNREDIQKAAVDRILYRGEQARFKDTIRRAINLLDKKAHLDPTFPNK